jgi:prepilin peptidase CpaA
LARPSDLIVLATLAAGVGIASAIDLRTRRIPNPLTGLLAATGVALAAAGISGLTVGASFMGLVLGLALLLPSHVIGATGAGDVKLFAAAGALIGPAPIVHALFYTALAGGLLAVVVALKRQRLRRTLGGTAQLIRTAAANAAGIEAPKENNRFAYAPAIAVGTLLAALGR